jgi:hypothetical protein
MEELAKFLASFEFNTPLYFWIVGALVLLLIFLPWFGKKRGFAIDLQYWKKKVAFKSKRVLVLSVPVVIASVLMIGVLSNPQVTTRTITNIYGYPVMVVLDISASMSVGGDKGTSFGSAIEAYYDLIARRGDINFGLLLFSADNYIARYCVNKNELLEDTVENIKELAYLSQLTLIPEALIKARQFLTDKIKGEDKTIVLISDMDVNASETKKIVEELNNISLAGINTYIIAPGIGILWEKNVPQISGLKFFTDITDNDNIEQIYSEISATQMSVIREEEGLLKKSLIPFLMIPALIVISLCLILSETRFLKIP